MNTAKLILFDIIYIQRTTKFTCVFSNTNDLLRTEIFSFESRIPQDYKTETADYFCIHKITGEHRFF